MRANVHKYRLDAGASCVVCRLGEEAEGGADQIGAAAHRLPRQSLGISDRATALLHPADRRVIRVQGRQSSIHAAG